MPEETLKQVVDRVKATIPAIGNAITNKGGTVSAGDGLEDFASDIATIPGGVKLKNDLATFRLITGVEELYIPYGATGIGYGCVQNAINLKKLVLPDSIVTCANFAFTGCTALTDVRLSESMSELTYQAFYGCSSLTQIDIPASMSNIAPTVFGDCNSLTTITVHKAEGSISGAPWGAPNATVVWTG